MPDLEAIRTAARRLLEEGLVEVVVAFKAGDTPLHPQPAFFRCADEVDELVYEGLCQNNLATYLTRLPKQAKVGMVVRGCENRSVNALVVERQKAREDLYLVGVPCEGILDWQTIVAEVGEAITSVTETGHDLMIETSAGYQLLERHNFLHDSCKRCIHPNPTSAEILIGDPIAEGDPSLPRSAVESFEARSIDERYAWFQKEAERCIRCYACRQACPMCYCEECFVDHIEPRWTESGATPAGMQGWHIVRAFHQTGRCTSCGACERACPMDIKMTYLTEKLNHDMREKYNFEAGLDAQSQPPFAAVTLDDKNRFKI